MSHDMLIFWAVVGGRLLIPLLIPRFPLPGILAAMILDAVDQTIFQQFTHLNLEGYQGYDKALDIYYLAIAYISTMRNWSNLSAYKISAFLFYFRMIGDMLFQLTQIRAILLIFPNTFEYFFDFYEAVKLRWKPARMTTKFLIGAAAFIWIFIKLPQEYWIHVAQLDTTDLIKTKIFHVSVETTFPEILKMFPLVIPILVGAMILLALLVWFILKKLPKADHKLSFEAVPEVKPFALVKQKSLKAKNMFNRELTEKIVMMTLIVIIFAQVIPGLKVSNVQLALGVIITLLANTVLTHLIKKISKVHFVIFADFILVSAINIILSIAYVIISPRITGEINFSAILFFSFMIGLLVTLYDEYNPYHQARVIKS